MTKVSVLKTFCDLASITANKFDAEDALFLLNKFELRTYMSSIVVLEIYFNTIKPKNNKSVMIMRIGGFKY